MTATPHNHQPALRRATSEPRATLSQRWTALHKKAGEIARMADLAPEPLDEIARRFAAGLAHSGALFGNHAHPAALRGVEDMEILVEMGLKALKEVEARGQDPSAPALALWREVYHSREAILKVMQPEAA